MYLLPLLLTTASIGLVFGVPQPFNVNRRDIQMDGGYPKFPPEEQGVSKLNRARFSTKDIPVDLRRKRGISEMNMKDAYDFMKEMYSAYQEIQGAQGGAAGGASEEESEEELERMLSRAGEPQFDPSQMSPELQQFWSQAMQLYQKFQAEQAAQESTGGEATSGRRARLAREGEKEIAKPIFQDSPNYINTGALESSNSVDKDDLEPGFRNLLEPTYIDTLEKGYIDN